MRKSELIAALNAIPGDPHIVYKNYEQYTHDIVISAKYNDWISTGSCKLKDVIELGTADEGTPAFEGEIGDCIEIVLDAEYFRKREISG